MADERDVEIKFGADASGVAPAVHETDAQVASLTEAVERLTAVGEQMGETLKEAFHKHTEAAKESEAELTRLEEGFRRVGERLLEYFTIREIVRWTGEVGEAGEKIEHLGEQLGISADDMQRLSGMATLSGQNIDSVANAVSRLDRSFAAAKEGSKLQAQAFAEIGVNTAKAYTQMELLEAVMDGFSNMEDGPQKTAVAMELLGRSGAALIPFLNEGKEGFAQMNVLVEKYGVLNADAQEKAASLGEALNEQKLAMAGLNNTLISALAPTIEQVIRYLNDLTAGFVQSTNAGGEAKTAMDDIIGVIRTLLAGLGYLIADVIAGAEVINALAWALTSVLAPAFDVVVGFVKACVEQLTGFGKVIDDLMHGRFADAAKDFTNTNKKAALEMSQTWDTAGSDFYRSVAKMSDALDVGLNAQARAKDFAAKMAKPPPEPHKGMGGKGEGGTTDGLPTGGAEKSQVPEWETQMSDAEVKWEQDHAGILRNVEQATADFWQNILNTETMSSKDREEVTRKLNAALIALNRQATAASLEDLRSRTDSAARETQSQLQVEKTRIAEEIRATEDAGNKRIISRTEEMVKISSLVQEQENAEVEAAVQIFELRKSLDEGVMAHYTEDTVEFKKALADKTAAEAAYQTAITKATADGTTQRTALERKAADDTMKQWQASVTPIVNSLGGIAKGLIEGTETMRQAWAKLGDFLLTTALNWVQKQIIMTIAGEETKTTAVAAGVAVRTTTETAGATVSMATSATSALVRIGHEAAVAAAGAYAAIADIPYVGPFLAPAAAALALGAVLALGRSIFSAEGGWGSVPYDGATTELHKEEMVLPATIARPLRSMISTWDEGSTLSGMQSAQAGVIPGPSQRPSKGGDNFIIKAMDSRSMERSLNRDPGMLARVAKKAQKRGN